MYIALIRAVKLFLEVDYNILFSQLYTVFTFRECRDVTKLSFVIVHEYGFP
jgi:hypothetical protein